MMTVAVKLHPERDPAGNPQVAQTEFPVDEIEVVVQALAAIRAQESLPALLVVPGLVGGAGFHGGEDMHQAGVVSPLLDDFPDAVFLAEGLGLADVLDGESVVPGHLFGIFPYLFAQGVGELGKIEYPYVMGVEVGGHAIGVPPRYHVAVNHNTVITGENALDLFLVPFGDHMYTPFTAFYSTGEKGESPVWYRLVRFRGEE